MDEISVWKRPGDSVTQSGFVSRITGLPGYVNVRSRTIFERLKTAVPGNWEQLGFYSEQYASSRDTRFAAGRRNMLGWGADSRNTLACR